MIPIEITELKGCAKEAAVKGQETLIRRADIPSRPSASSCFLINSLQVYIPKPSLDTILTSVVRLN